MIPEGFKIAAEFCDFNGLVEACEIDNRLFEDLKCLISKDEDQMVPLRDWAFTSSSMSLSQFVLSWLEQKGYCSRLCEFAYVVGKSELNVFLEVTRICQFSFAN